MSPPLWPLFIYLQPIASRLWPNFMKVGYYQFNPVFGDVARNLERVAKKLSSVRCDLMVLPELFASGYQFVSKDEVAALAEPVPDGATTTRLCEVARERSMHIVAGLPERDGSRY